MMGLGNDLKVILDLEIPVIIYNSLHENSG
jgi:hypothetical protein